MKRRNARQFEPKGENNDSDYGIMIQERFLKREDETFKRTKSNVFQFHSVNRSKNNWMMTSKNIIRIQEITLKANNFDYFNNINGNKNKSKIRRTSTLIAPKDIMQNKRTRITILPLNLKRNKSLKITYKNKEPHLNFSILETKKFFTRNKVKKIGSKEIMISSKEDHDFSSLNDNSFKALSINDVSNYKLEEYYYLLLNCIYKNLNKNFIKIFEKIEKKIDINQDIYEGNTLLIFSTKEGNLAITKFLCTQGADVNIQNDEGNTALHYAIANQFFTIVDLLKDNGAKEYIVNDKGFTPWDCVEHGL